MEIITNNGIDTAYGCIYVWRNKLNNKCYVGQTLYPNGRKYRHLRSKDNTHFHRALQKYGEENFDYFEVFATYAPVEILSDILNEKEIYFINKYDSFNNGYNMTIGGCGSNGYKHSEETKIKMRKKHKPFYGRDHNGENNPTYGLERTEEWRKRISEANKGRKHNDEFKLKCSERTKGTIWICNETTSMMIKPTDLDLYIAKGYIKGRKYKNTQIL